MIGRCIITNFVIINHVGVVIVMVEYRRKIQTVWRRNVLHISWFLGSLILVILEVQWRKEGWLDVLDWSHIEEDQGRIRQGRNFDRFLVRFNRKRCIWCSQRSI